jgi:hypothetical protein
MFLVEVYLFNVAACIIHKRSQLLKPENTRAKHYGSIMD